MTSVVVAPLDANLRLHPAARDTVSAVFTTGQAAASLANGLTHIFDCTAGSITQPLPAAPAVGTTLGFKRVDAPVANTLTLTAGGSDTIESGIFAVASLGLGAGRTVTLTYTTGVWTATAGLLTTAGVQAIGDVRYEAIGAAATAVATEATNRATADTANSTAISAEQTRATTAEGVNATAIDAEATTARAAEELRAPLASPALTGRPTAPTAAPGTDTTQVATTAFAIAASLAAGVVVLPPGVTMAGTSAGAVDTDTTLTAFGFHAATANTSGTQNTAVGYTALSGNVTGNQQTAIGYRALVRSIGNGNTAVGAQVLNANTSGAGNSALGVNAMEYNTTGSYNVGVGQQALQDNTTGSGNVSIGFSALQTSVASQNNVVLGTGAMRLANDTGGFHVAIGYQALQSYRGTAGQQVAIGSSALQALTGGVGRNVAVGGGTLYSATTGDDNTAVGDNVLHLLTTGKYDTAVGVDSQKYTTTGIYNTSIGVDSLCDLTTGSYNAAMGEGAGGANNISSGGQVGTGFGTVTGSWNTFCGENASVTKTDPSFVTSLGAQTSCSANGGVAIGIDSTGLAAASNLANLIALGTAHHTTRIAGLPAFVTGDRYVVADSTGRLHRSALGPAS